MKTLLITSAKGGTGRTALLCQFAHYLHSMLALRVLVIDLAEPACSTASLARAHRADVLRGGASAIQPAEARHKIRARGFWVLPVHAVPSLSFEPGADEARYYANLRHLLSMLAAFADVCLIDSPPIPDLRTVCVESVVDALVSPIQFTREALDSVDEFINGPRGVRQVRAKLNPALHCIGLLPNMVEGTPLQRAIAREIEAEFGAWLISDPTAVGDYLRVPRFTAITEAQAAGISVSELGGKDPAARRAWQTMRACFETLARQLDLNGPGRKAPGGNEATREAEVCHA
jgi:chromosome partitioning protein